MLLIKMLKIAVCSSFFPTLIINTNHYPDISNIDDRARKLYDIYFKEISNDHLIVVNDEGWKKRRAHGYLKHFYKQHQKGKN